MEIINLKVLGWRSGEYPEIDLQVTCGEGTYIRALARDFGDRLGTGGTLAGLVRELSCGMDLAQSITLEKLENVVTNQEELPLLLPHQVLSHLPVVNLDQDLEKRWFQGQRLALPDLAPGIVRVEGDRQNFLGIALVTAEEYGTVLRPKVVMT